MRNGFVFKGILFLLLLISINSLLNYCLASTPVYPITATRISSDRRCVESNCSYYTVENANNAKADDGLYSRMYANSGAIAGLGSYKSVLDLGFGHTIPANTTTYIRINGDESLFQSLLGGSLGDLLSEVLGSVLFGQQEIIIEARTSSYPVLSRSSIDGFDTNRVRLVSDESGNFYVAIKPNASYDRIRITNKASSVAGFNKTYLLDVYHAFYYPPDPCGGQPIFTSYDGSGISLEVLEANSAVESLNLAIDSDLDNTFSEISLGVVGVAGTVEQMIYFNSPVQPGNEVLISMATGSSLLDLGLLNHVELVAYNNGSVVSVTSASSLLELDVLGLLASGEFFKFPISSDVSAIDQIGIRVSSLVGAGLLEGSLKISGVTVEPVRPEIPDVPEEGFYEVCCGQTITVTPNNTAGGNLNWYRVEADSEMSLGSSATYSPPIDLLPGDYEFLVKSTGSSCFSESEPSRFKLKVNPIPTPANYSIQPSGEIGIDEDGKYKYVEGINPVTLNPNLMEWDGEGDFKWFLDENMTIPLEDGDVIDEVLYEVEEGVLTMTGLKFRDETDPYKFYLNWVPEDGCGPNEVKELDLSSIVRILNVTLLDFQAHSTSEGNVLISWQLAVDKPDQDLDLIVQRAGNDLIFKDIWTDRKSEFVDFSFLDTVPLIGENYYRLEVRNFHGEPEFTSDLRRVFVSERDNKPFVVFPNEFQNFFSIRSSELHDKKISYSLFTSEGSLLRSGSTKISLQTSILIEGLEAHSPGRYILLIEENGRSFIYHLIKK
ncbi:hypothetical protein [uncultured Algoriphagus sp.]|uniref:hypothetical protein n=1 Tax=uncultured Algoriphagus sp. TaxID=417365 RepID=UPI0030EF756E|tara:strand:+ start:62526 stop:64850 length:2325 start_codon:yes stop_codon:yes gene_type:complete